MSIIVSVIFSCCLVKCSFAILYSLAIPCSYKTDKNHPVLYRHRRSKVEQPHPRRSIHVTLRELLKRYTTHFTLDSVTALTACPNAIWRVLQSTLLFYHEPQSLSSVQQPQFSGVTATLVAYFRCRLTSAPHQISTCERFTSSAAVRFRCS